MKLPFVSNALAEHAHLMSKAAMLQQKTDSRNGANRATRDESRRSAFMRTAQLLGSEFATLPWFALVASISAGCVYACGIEKHRAQGDLLDVFTKANATAVPTQSGTLALQSPIQQLKGLQHAWPTGTAALQHLLLVLFLEWFLSLVQDYCSAQARSERRVGARVRLMASVMRQDASWLDKQGTAELANRVQHDADVLDDIVLNTLERVFRGAAALYTIYYLMVRDPGLTMLALTLRLPQIVQLVDKGIKIAASYELLHRHTLSLAQARAMEAISHAKLMQAYTAEGQEVRAYAAAMQEHARTVRASALSWAIFKHAEGALLVLTEILLLAYGGYRILTGRSTVGAFTAMRFLVASFIDRFHGLEEIYHSFRRASLLAHRYFELRDREPAIPLPLPLLTSPSTSSAQQAPHTLHASLSKPTPLELRFEHVSFSYSRQDASEVSSSSSLVPVLRDVTRTIPAGSFVALVGPSGGGKSTLVRLLLRMYDPSAGRIVLGGRPLPSWDTHALRRAVGFVDQEAAMLDRSVLKNLCLGIEGLGDVTGEGSSELTGTEGVPDAVISAAKSAQAHEFICALPRGYHTSVGERGGRISGGQRQRLAIARAILRNPSVLILDEATASLDAASETAVTGALSTLMRGRTTLMVAHRLSTIQGADCILVLDKGRIVEAGRHSELVSKAGGLYAQLVRDAASHGASQRGHEDEHDEDVGGLGKGGSGLSSAHTATRAENDGTGRGKRSGRQGSRVSHQR